MADYLESYAAAFPAPVRLGTRVEKLTPEELGYVVLAGGRRLEANHVVVAMSSYQRPRVPRFAAQLDPRIVQMTSLEYRRPTQLPVGDVLVVGAANSGPRSRSTSRAQVAASGCRAGTRARSRSPIENPVALRVVVPVLFRVVFHRVLTTDTPIGRRARPNFMSKGLPLILLQARASRRRRRDVRAAHGGGTRRQAPARRRNRPRSGERRVVHGVRHRQVVDRSSRLRRPRGPVQSKGMVPGEPGLYFVGPHFLYSASSTTIHGIGRDARRVAETIGGRLRTTAAAAHQPHGASE